ncbi:MAG: hypothetical protein HQ521_17725 [Bacteroidetes bacterium]|nr:hypothetical protein [Bacteroidota bacterium]
MSDSDFKITLEEQTNNNSLQLYISGELTIENSISIHNYLLNNALEHDSVGINICDSTSIDLSMIQLIIGFIATRNNTGKVTTVEFNIYESDNDIINKTGAIELLSLLQKNQKV